MIVNRLAWIALVSVIILVLAGATVRVTGSGLGCPDWPTCWGCIIPPTSVDQIDVDKLDIEKFKRHAIRKGIDPDTITRDTILDSFNPVHTWIEFSNRLITLPLGLAALLLALLSFTARNHRGWIVALAWLSLADVVVNAVMGAQVVASGLQPGIITLHMALAFLLIVVLVTIIWLSRPDRQVTPVGQTNLRPLLVISILFFACLFAEGLLGSQVREQTDELAQAAGQLSRDQWIGELATTWIYKIHRSFSWSLLISAGLMLLLALRIPSVRFVEPKWIIAMVLAMMLMGVVMAHIAVYQVVQVLHVGTTAVLLAVTWHWIIRLGSIARRVGANQADSPNS